MEATYPLWHKRDSSDLISGLEWSSLCLTADGVEVVVAGDSHVDVGAGQVGPVLLQDRLVPDGLAPTVQQRQAPVVPTGPDLI